MMAGLLGEAHWKKGLLQTSIQTPTCMKIHTWYTLTATDSHKGYALGYVDGKYSLQLALMVLKQQGLYKQRNPYMIGIHCSGPT